MEQKSDSDGSGNGWQAVPEVGNGLWRVAFFAFCLKIFGRKVARFFVVVVFLFAFPFLKTPRRFSAQFLARVHAQTWKKYSVFKHLLAFAFSLLDKLAVRLGQFHFENARIRTVGACEQLNRELAQKRGAFLICSHLGNAEMLRVAFPRSAIGREVPLNVVMSVSATAHFQKTMQRFDVGGRGGKSGRVENLFPVDKIGAGTAMVLEEKIARGEIVVMAGDRVLGARERVRAMEAERENRLPFLGEEAPFPVGVFRFACAIGYPIYAAFLLPAKKGDATPELSLFPLTVPAGTPPKRAAKIIRQNFVSILEKQTLENPYQWFNFFDFWQKQ